MTFNPENLTDEQLAQANAEQMRRRFAEQEEKLKAKQALVQPAAEAGLSVTLLEELKKLSENQEAELAMRTHANAAVLSLKYLVGFIPPVSNESDAGQNEA